MSKFLLLAFLAVLTVALGQSVNSANAQFQSAGGSINVISTNGVWMSLQWASLTEYDQNGNVVQSVDLSKHSFGWSQPEVLPFTVDTVNTKEHFPAVNFTHELDNGCWFNVTAWLLNADSNWTSAKHEDVKWSFNIGVWPWVGGARSGGEGQGYGTLVLNAGLVGFGGVVRSTTNQEIHGAGTTTTATAGFAQGFLSSPTQALYDGTMGPVGVSHTLSGKPEVFYTFNYFANLLVYDPTFSPKTGSTSNGNSGSNSNSKAPSNPTSTSGGAQFNPDGSFGISTNGNWMALQWATLAEVAPNGTAVQVVDLESHAFGWSQPEVLPVIDTNGIPTGPKFPSVNFSEELINGAWFNVTAWILPSNATNAAQKHGEVKWSIGISNWPWVSPAGGENSGSLVLTAGMVGFGGIVRSDDNQAAAGSNVTVQTATYGSGFLSSPNQATYDGWLGTVGVEHSLSGKPEVFWTFQQFQNYVSYDPDVGVVDSKSAENVWAPNGPAMISIYTILGVLLVVGLVVSIYFVTRVKGNRRFSNEGAKLQEQMDLSPPGTEVSTE